MKLLWKDFYSKLQCEDAHVQLSLSFHLKNVLEETQLLRQEQQSVHQTEGVGEGVRVAPPIVSAVCVLKVKEEE